MTTLDLTLVLFRVKCPVLVEARKHSSPVAQLVERVTVNH